MIKAAREYFTGRFTPLQQLLILGGLARLFAVIFSKGFGWHDDHFLIIEAAQSWVDGFDYNYWLPDASDPSRHPQGHSFTYVGLHYYIFKFFHAIGLNDPQVKMYIIRLLHALWSLLIINYGYKIALSYSTPRTAWYTGLFLALLWFMPFMSVRNLAEFVCVPPLLAAIYFIIRSENRKQYLLAGLLFGLACSMRFQAVFIIAGVGIALLLMRTSIKNILVLTLGFVLVVCLTQGVVDYLLWGRPFAEFTEYYNYNKANATVYGTDNWHMYFDLILGLPVPPLSILLFAGYFYTWRKMPLIFWPVLVYLTFHTLFPNKQERFIMTILPLMIISGTVGMFMIHEKYKTRISRRLFVWGRNFVVGLNVLLLLVLTTSYSKRHRVESMYYMYKKNDSNTFYVEDSNKADDFLMPPLYYYGKWFSVCGISKTYNADSALVRFNRSLPEERPAYVVFWQAENIQARVDSMKKRFPDLVYETTIEPSFIDKVLYKLNPLNDNQTAFIYRFTDVSKRSAAR
jgi:hypothetical protein